MSIWSSSVTRVILPQNVLLIGDYHCHSTNKNEKLYAPVAFGLRLFLTNQLKFSRIVKEFLSVYFAFEAFEHYVWGVTDKPIIVLRYNTFTRLFPAKQLPGNLWRLLDYELNYKIFGDIFPVKRMQLSIVSLESMFNHQSNFNQKQFSVQNIKFKLSQHRQTSLTEICQPNDTCAATVTINSVEENFLPDVLLENNTLLSMC